MNMEKFKESFWTTHDHRKIKFKDLSNDHLINLIDHTKRQDLGVMLYRNLLELSLERGLTQSDLNRAQIPHLDTNGTLCVMNYDSKSVYLETIPYKK